MSDSYFEREEGVVIGDGVYFKLDPASYSSSPKEEPKTLQVFSQILTFENTTLVLTTVRDMSYWLDLEKQKNMSKLQTVAFASAAHEFKNPLNAIVSSLEILEPLIDKKRGI
jgi:signal transduction histidine kinase